MLNNKIKVSYKLKNSYNKVRLFVKLKKIIFSDTFYFDLPKTFEANNDCIAAAVSTLIGSKYKNIYFNFPISNNCKTSLEKRYNTKINSKFIYKNFKTKKGSNLLLNFSGGFDSLAASALMPGKTIKLGLDFGGWFKRETDFLVNNKVENIISTDFRLKKYDRNTHDFMACISILCSEHYNLKGIAFGSILEASPAHIFSRNELTKRYKNKNINKIGYDRLFNAVNVDDYTVTRGLTEFSTTLIAFLEYPSLIDESLKSLASFDSEKRYRKELLLICAQKKLGIQHKDIYSLVSPSKKINFGDSFSTDFIMCSLACYLGNSFPDHIYTGLSDKTRIALQNINSDFLFKYCNWEFLKSKEASKRLDIQKLAKYKVEVFTEKDWNDFEEFICLLEKLRL